MFQKFRQAVLWRVSCHRAVDRLEYLGIFRMQLFHLATQFSIIAICPVTSEVTWQCLVTSDVTWQCLVSSEVTWQCLQQ